MAAPRGKTTDPNGPQNQPKPNQPNRTPQGGGARPTLSRALKDKLEKHFDAQGDFGTHAGPTEAAVRRLMREGVAAGLNDKQVSAFLNPAFYRGAADPYGGGRLLKDLTPEQLKALSAYAAGAKGSGLGANGSATDSQKAFFDAFPDLQQKYAAMANVYTNAPDLTNGMSTVPPNAVLGSDGKYHDPYQPLPEGVTIPGGPLTRDTAPTDTAPAGGSTEGTFQPFTDISGTQTGVPGYPVTQYATPAEGMMAAHTALASHYASAAAAGDFSTASALQGTLAQHQALMPQDMAVSNPVPDTFNEQHLYEEAQNR